MRTFFVSMVFVSLFLGLNAQSSLNFELKEIDTSRVYNFHPECNGANNAGVWEGEHMVVLTENIYPTEDNYETMKVFANYFDALFATYMDITNGSNIPIDGSFGSINGKPTYHITTNMCPGYAGAASHGVLGNATGMGFYDQTIGRIESGDTSFCQVYTYEMHRNFWWGTSEWVEKIGWYVDNNPLAWGHWTLAMNVANGTLLTEHLGVGVFEDYPYLTSEAFYDRNTEPFLYYLEHPEFGFDNCWLKGLIPFNWLSEARGVNNLMTGLAIYSFENFGGMDWLKGFYNWLQNDEILADHGYTDFQNARDNMYRVWSMAADSCLLNFFESDLRFDVSQEAINWVADKLAIKINEPSALVANVMNANQIDLSWNDNNSTETGFTLERRLKGETDFVVLATLSPNQTSYSDNVSGEYEYRINTFDGINISEYSNVVAVNSAVLAPEKPADLTFVDASSESIVVGWTAPAGVDILASEVSISSVADGSELLYVQQSSASELRVKNLEVNSSYVIKVRVYSEGGFSPWSEMITANTEDVVPDAPSILDVNVLSSNSIELVWRDKSDNEDGFHIRRKTINTVYEVVDTTEANVTSMIDTGLEASTTYYYKVRAFNEVGKSASSKEREATTKATEILRNIDGAEGFAYPNPVRHLLNISFKGPELEEKEVLLYDAAGKLRSNFLTSGKEFKMQRGEIESGTYILVVAYSNGEKEITKLLFE